MAQGVDIFSGFLSDKRLLVNRLKVGYFTLKATDIRIF
jgi:hypothetical protein